MKVKWDRYNTVYKEKDYSDRNLTLLCREYQANRALPGFHVLQQTEGRKLFTSLSPQAKVGSRQDTVRGSD